jgi:hypothetical protein
MAAFLSHPLLVIAVVRFAPDSVPMRRRPTSAIYANLLVFKVGATHDRKMG